MTNRSSFAPDVARDYVNEPRKCFIDPHNPRLPTAIRTLHPLVIEARDTEVSLELHCGFDHYGVIAFAATATTSVDSVSDMLELTPGLWYYDEGLYYDRDASWLKKLKAMKPKDAATPAWHNR
jgi:hypothetical protein